MEDLTGGLNQTLMHVMGFLAQQKQQEKTDAYNKLNALAGLGQSAYIPPEALMNAARGAGIDIPQTPPKTSKQPQGGVQTAPPTQWQPNPQDVRADGSQKGTGWLGVLKRPDGRISSEISIGVNLDGKETEIPTIVPTLNKEELDYLLATDPKNPELLNTPLGQSIKEKAIAHAQEQMKQGKSPFNNNGEQPPPMQFNKPVPRYNETRAKFLQERGIDLDQNGKPMVGAIQAKMLDEEAFKLHTENVKNWQTEKEEYTKQALTQQRELAVKAQEQKDHLERIQKEQDLIKQREIDVHKANQEKWSDPYLGSVGGKKVLLRKSLTTNKVEQVTADSSTTIKLGEGLSGASGVTTIGPLNKEGKNEKALDGLGAGDQSVIKALVDYRVALPTGAALRSQYWQDVLKKATEYDPTFDEKMYPTRQRMAVAYSSGKQGQSITSLNTLVNHGVDRLFKSGEALKNGNIQFVNWIKNTSRELMGDKRITRFKTDLVAATNEAATTFKGTGATDQEIAAWRDTISKASSWEQIRQGFVDEMAHLMAGRLKPMADRYEVTMGKPLRILDPNSAKILKSHGIDPSQVDSTYTEDTSSTPKETTGKVGKHTYRVVQ